MGIGEVVIWEFGIMWGEFAGGMDGYVWWGGVGALRVGER